MLILATGAKDKIERNSIRLRLYGPLDRTGRAVTVGAQDLPVRRPDFYLEMPVDPA